jgi:hypothetical protein
MLEFLIIIFIISGSIACCLCLFNNLNLIYICFDCFHFNIKRVLPLTNNETIVETNNILNEETKEEFVSPV